MLNPPEQGVRTGRFAPIALAVLVVICAAELFLSSKQLSQTWDEGLYLLAGYRYWQCADFGFNSQHPPLLKLIAAAPLRWMKLRHPEVPCGAYEVGDEFEQGRKFLYANNAERMLMEGRMAAALFSVALLFVLWRAASTMFGLRAALFASVLLVLEPNLLAHGASVTTDLAVATGFFAAVFGLYQYFQGPNAGRAALVGGAMGAALSSKFSGLLLIPVLMALTCAEMYWRLIAAPPRRSLRPLRAAAHLAIACAMAGLLIWALYGFRFAVRPRSGYFAGWERVLHENQQTTPIFKAEKPTALFAGSRVTAKLRKFRVLPEPYLEGTDRVLESSAGGRRMFLFGRTYENGRWFYFPLVLSVKLTVPLLLLVCAACCSKPLWRQHGRELVYLSVPPLAFLLFSMQSVTNIGVRHVLPVFPFLLVMGGAEASWLASSRKLLPLALLLVTWHVGTSLHAFPNYLSYANEVFGGPSAAYKWVSDSNVDWGQSLKQVQEYAVRNPGTPCWFLQNGTADAGYYGIPCDVAFEEQYAVELSRPLPERMRGTIFISSQYVGNLGWFSEYGIDPLRPFRAVAPVDRIGGSSVLVYRGDFRTPELASVSSAMLAYRLSKSADAELALEYATRARELSPAAAYPYLSVCAAYTRLKNYGAAAAHCQAGMQRLLAHPGYNHDLIMIGRLISAQLDMAMHAGT